MTRRVKASHIQTALILVAVVALLSWGVLGVLWTSPYEQGEIINAALTGIRVSATDAGPNGNGTTIRPGTEAQFIMDFKTSILPGHGVSTYNTPNGEGYIISPLLWMMTNSTLESYQVLYAVFIWQFTFQLGPQPLMWFSGPQGNLTASYETSTLNRIQGTNAFRNMDYQTSLFEVPTPGNYTLNYLNIGNQNVSGIVGMGPGLVTFTHPYVYAGITSITIAGLLIVATGLAFRSGRKRKLQSSTPGKN